MEDGDEAVFATRGEMPDADQLRPLPTALHDAGVREQLERASVGIAGCGGLGSTVAVVLGRSGVGRLVLVDFDVVEPRNLDRQQFFIDQIGQAKVDALGSTLARIDPGVRVVRHRQRLTRALVSAIFAECDVVAECFDDPSAKAELATAMRMSLPATPLVAASGIAGYGSAESIRSRRIFGNSFLIGDGETDAQSGPGLLAPRVTVAAGHQANVILRLLLGAISEDEGG